MKPFRAFMIPTAAIVLVAVAAQTQAAPLPPAYPYPPAGWYHGYPEMIDRVSEILDAIDNPSEKSMLAKDWLKFSKLAITRSLEQREGFLSIQARQLRHQEEIERADVDIAKLQLRIEQLRAENLKLERENLELRRQMQGQANGQENTGNQTAGNQ